MLSLMSCAVGSNRVILTVTVRVSSSFSRLEKISEIPKTPTATPTKSMPLRRLSKPNVNRVADVKTSEPVNPNRTPTIAIAIPFSTEPCDSATVSTRPRVASAKYSGAPNATANFARTGANSARTSVAMQPAINEPIAAIASAAPAPPLLRHLIAVDRGHGRRRFARNIDENRGGGAAVLSAVIDAREHDQRGQGRQRRGDRQKHRDRCQWTDAGEHADQGSEQDTDEAYEERSRRERLAEAQEDPVQDFHMRARRGT